MVTSLYPTTISTDGSATLRAALEGPGCLVDASGLSLNFIGASPSGADVAVPGQLDGDCGSATFQVAKSSAFRGVRAGSYRVRISAGRDRPPLSFVCTSKANATGANTTTTRETTLVTVVEAAVGRFLGQSVTPSSTNLTITLTVGLDGPTPLPTTMGLRLSDPTAAAVSPPTLTWRPGEMGAKQFKLRVSRPPPPPSSLQANGSAAAAAAAPWALVAEALPVSNLLFPDATTSQRWAVQVPVPAFYVVPNHAAYRGGGGNASRNASGGDGGGSGGGNSSNAGGSGGAGAAGAGVESVAVAVRRAAPSPFPSALDYTAVVLQAIACPAGSPCASAVRGNGSLRFPPEADVAFAELLVNWTALPPGATLRVGLRLAPAANAEALPAPANATALFVFGVPYGVCPAGTLGPWRDPAAPVVVVPSGGAGGPPGAIAFSAYLAGPGSGVGAPASLAAAAAAASAQPVLNSTCNDTALLVELLARAPAAGLLPVLAACAGGSINLIPPSNASVAASGAAVSAPAPPLLPPPSPPPLPSPRSTPSGEQAQLGAEGGEQPATTPVELVVPFGRDAAAALLPLGSAAETVVVLHTTCSPQPSWRTVVLPVPDAAGGAGGAAAGGVGDGSGAGGGLGGRGPATRAFARWLLPAALRQSCFALVGVYTALSQPQAQVQAQARQQGAQGAAAAAHSPPSPVPAPGGVNPGRSLLGPAGEGNAVAPSSPSVVAARVLSSPTGSAAAGPSPVASPAPAPAPASGQEQGRGQGIGASDGGMSVVSMVRLRAYNLTLRPMSDPRVFASLALALRNQSSGRILPLCGLPQRLLAAAAAQLFPAGSGGGSGGPTSKQLAAAAAVLAQAIRGDAAAVVKLQLSSGAPPGGGRPSGRRLRHALVAVLEAPRRWMLSGWLALGSLVPAPVPENMGGGAVEAGAGGAGGEVVGLAGGQLGAAARRQLKAANDTQPVPAAAAAAVAADAAAGAAQQPSSPVTGTPAPAAPSSDAGDAPPPGSEPEDAPSAPWPPTVPPPASPGPRPLSAAGSSPSPGLDAGPLAPGLLTDPNSPTPSPRPGLSPGPAASEAVAATAPDGFDMPGGSGGTVHVLFNRQFLDSCGAGDAQVVDLALLAAAREDMALEASSGGVALRQADGGVAVVGAAARSALLGQREAAAAAEAAAADRPDVLLKLVAGAGSGGGGDVVSKSMLTTRGPAGETLVASIAAAGGEGGAGSTGGGGGGGEAKGNGTAAPSPTAGPGSGGSAQSAPPPGGGSSPRASSAPNGAAPGPGAASAGGPPAAPGVRSGESGGGGGGDGGRDQGCLDDSARLAPDQRLSVSLLAPDGISATTATLALYIDYTEAVTLAITEAAQCVRNNSNSAGRPPASPGGLAGSGGEATAMLPSATAPPPAQPAAPRPPAAAAGGSRVLSSLFDACRLCGPGSYGASSPNASACLPCSPGTASGDPYNAGCDPCQPGSFAVQWGSAACRLCPAGSFAPRNGSTSCSVCPPGTTTMADGQRACVAAPPPPSAGDGGGGYALLVSFQVVVNVSQGGDVASLGANTTGIDAPPDSIVRLLVAADTAEALRIPPTQVRVFLQEVSPSSFLVNVSATLPLGSSPTTSPTASPSSSSASSSASSSSSSSPSKEVDADTLINRLVSNPGGSFPRTKEATGGSLQVQYVERQVVSLGGRGGGVNPHVVVWPTLGGTALLAVVLGLACSRYCRRRRGRAGAGAGVSLPPLSDALGRLWGGPASVPPVYLMYGSVPALELQALPQPAASSALAPRHRRGNSKSGLGVGGMGLGLGGAQVSSSSSAAAVVGQQSGGGGGGGGAADLSDVLASMYTREALAGPRI